MEPGTGTFSEGVSAGGPQPPAGLRSRYSVRDGRVVVALPAFGLMGCLAVWFLCLFALIGLLIYIFVDSKGNWVPVAFFGGIGGFILAALYFPVAPESITLEIDPAHLRIINRGLVFSSATDLAATQVSEIYRNFQVIAVVKPDGKQYLGAHLSDAEREWIQLILCRVLNARGAYEKG